ncbi:unnamed protein product [Bursaphelenchus okinawaensis]|uniref:A4_EXTRA domain-containing protein n=1 Tax=Bursaphelenchus okinawaensis TaxID=465554 RepID=A0A811KNH4_9BILA|nr:unnamed protein product [Bursaphelenchus okinawaensis]CAG9106734.1 unnamed protein product [Bursaphelenchus okinawaensis]
MAGGTPLALALLAILAAISHAKINSVSASIDRKNTAHHNFIPMVAFKCGYRNKYLNESGDWESDPSSVATCLQGKLDILKYCKRVYPDKKITNIVEYGHISQIPQWCDEDTGRHCQKTFYIRPYRCLEGEFTADSLQVPSRCKFGHVSGRETCEGFRQWRQKGERQCEASVDEKSQKPMRLHSFGLLEPCGLSLFRGVEYVCCPKDVEDKFVEENLEDDIQNYNLDDDEEDDDDDDDDDDEEETSTESKDSDGQDPYLQEDSEADEHERYKDAQERLEKKHRAKVTKVINEWSQLFERYNTMKEKDPNQAEEFKDEMTNKFRKTVAALENENKDQRRQLEQVHDERVQNTLNERKRKATHDYRMALALQVGQKNKKQVLKTLKDYIRAEEKDRAYMLHRYRHLLRSNSESAQAYEPMLLHRLRYIDLRINGTLAMLRDFPDLERQLKPIAEEFWREYRKENTPDADEHKIVGTSDANEQLIKFYKDTYDKSGKVKISSVLDKVMKENEHKPEHKTKFISLDEIVSDRHHGSLKADEARRLSDEDSDVFNVKKHSESHKLHDDDEDFMKFHKKIDSFKSVGDEAKFDRVKPESKTFDSKKTKEDEFKSEADFDSDEDQFEEDDEAEEPKKNTVVIKSEDSNDVEIVHKEPIVQEKDLGKKLDDDEEEEGSDESDEDDDEDLNEEEEHIVVNNEDLYVRKEVGPSFARQDQLLVDYFHQPLEQSSSWTTPTTLIVLATVVMCAMGIVGIVLKHRPSRQGFVEVDVCNPDDGDVSKMQINGYENPTYNFYDQKP